MVKDFVKYGGLHNAYIMPFRTLHIETVQDILTQQP